MPFGARWLASLLVAELTWGDEVVVVANAPPLYRPGSRAWVVGVRPGAPAEHEKLLTIEYEDGSSIEVPASTLERA